ncbi:sarcosine oxidase subunit delta [Siculibacillus lacustris]|uniref:Sarcosine oxidase subunit delta n=1 Tax=Siculibacillus lacustris TaxID=1549641 RepID=A0A4Q9VHJ0_9HYPH|nr:sarcosine oxidase subunit delta [Siculibacillus lacustris]TBW34612.1 sarcosine oxidase subunit delta [Siculibacillus lacustris]
MLLVPCPWCGPRPELEFVAAGEAHVARPSPDADPTALAEALYFRANTKGLIAERWRHLHGCGRFFNAVRHTVTDKFVMSYRPGDPAPDLARLAETLAAEAAL